YLVHQSFGRQYNLVGRLRGIEDIQEFQNYLKRSFSFSKRWDLDATLHRYMTSCCTVYLDGLTGPPARYLPDRK
ncbi:Hypothetical predicted protein, partial [Pelobates cultripes]